MLPANKQTPMALDANLTGLAAKGDVLARCVPRLLMQTAASRRRCFVCGHCGRPCGSPSQQVSVARGQKRRAAVESPAYKLPDPSSDSCNVVPRGRCYLCSSSGCDEVFCTEECRSAACEQGPHLAFCRGRGSNSRELWCHSNATGDTIQLAATLVAQAARSSMMIEKTTKLPDELQLLDELLNADIDGHLSQISADEVEDNRLLLFLVLVHDLGWVQAEPAEHDEEPDSIPEQEMSQECRRALQEWKISKEALAAKRAAFRSARRKDKLSSRSVHTDERLRIMWKALSPTGYGCLVHALEQRSLRLEVPSSLASICQELVLAPTEQLGPCLDALAPFLKAAMANDAKSAEEGGTVPDPFCRQAARLAQAGQAALWGGENPFAHASASMLAVMDLPFEHSCIPNASLEVEMAPEGLRARLAASRDIAAGELRTTAHVQIEQPLLERGSALQARFGPAFECDCIRCRHEDFGERAELAVEDLRLLADCAAHAARHDEAFRLYGEVLKHVPDDGDAWHARGTALYESGRWAEGNEMFLAGALVAPKHAQLCVEVEKIAAYRLPMSPAAVEPGGSLLPLPAWGSFLSGRCFLTTGGDPLVPADECAAAVAAAEAHAAARGGWSTVRHHAVPTTDLNIHEVPALRTWFIHLAHSRLRPLMAAQFGSEAVGEHGQQLRIGDAFLVKYTAEGGSKHIPVHQDYSTHSLTIALNPSSEYNGGGTYFCELGRSLQPGLGHVVSFLGDLKHGGDPITKGVRYIVAAFLYVDEDGGACACGTVPGSAPRLPKRRQAEVDSSRLKRSRAHRVAASHSSATSPAAGATAVPAGATSVRAEHSSNFGSDAMGASWLETLAGSSDGGNSKTAEDDWLQSLDRSAALVC